MRARTQFCSFPAARQRHIWKTEENADSQLYLNTTSALSKDAYSIDTEKNTITIPANQLKLGDNALTLQVDTFQKVRLTLTVAKQLEKNLSLSVAETTESGKPVVVFTVDGSNGDFLKNLASVKLDDKTDIGTYGYYGYGSEMAYYVIGKDNKTISLYNVPSGEHTVAISAKYYGEPLTAKFTVNAKPAEAAKSAPTVSGAKKKTDTSYTGTYSYYRLSFTGLNASDLTTYLAKVNQVKVNDTVLTRGYSSSSLADNNFRPAATNTTYSTSAYDVLDLPVSLFANAGDYKIKLTADGYTDVEYTLTVGDSSSSGDSSNSGSSGSTVTAPTKLPTISKGSNMYCTLTFSGAATWLAQDGLTVTVNDSVYQKTDSIYNLDGGGAYYVEDDRISLKIPYGMFTSTTSKLVISDGTTNINLTVTIPDYSYW